MDDRVEAGIETKFNNTQNEPKTTTKEEAAPENIVKATAELKVVFTSEEVMTMILEQKPNVKTELDTPSRNKPRHNNYTPFRKEEVPLGESLIPGAERIAEVIKKEKLATQEYTKPIPELGHEPESNWDLFEPSRIGYLYFRPQKKDDSLNAKLEEDLKPVTEFVKSENLINSPFSGEKNENEEFGQDEWDTFKSKSVYY